MQHMHEKVLPTSSVSQHVLDVLLQFPLDVSQANIWELLSHQDRCNLRLCSNQARTFTVTLVTFFSLTIADQASIDTAYPYPDARAHFLTTLTRVVTLEIASWLDHEQLATALLVYSSSPAGRVTALTLSCSNVARLSISSMCAVALAFPKLQVLTLLHQSNEGDDPGVLASALSLPLNRLTALTEVRC